ncbi:retrovirus-related Pol polyprotein from transposon TNT 1-94 [Trichonephila clavipes]|nr:retrovirus-related Pol polyprotein from transposon TNT 1-94 [Trichonephila clavipes]
MLAHTITLGYSLKEFLCDNGEEFDNEDVRDIIHSNGITKRLTAPYTLEKNGASEREMRTTIEMARIFKYSNPEAHIPAQKRRKVDKAIHGYLVGYDADEQYRIWLKKEHRAILSRDVIFQEKAGKCDDHTELRLEDKIREDTSQGKYEEQLIKIEDNLTERTQSQEDLSDTVTDREEDAGPTADRQLMNHSILQKPKRFEDHIMEAESYLDDYNPEAYEEAVNSKDSTNWKKAMESEMNSLSENHTWVLSDLPVAAKATPYKWVYKLKTNPDGSINNYKAILVARDFSVIARALIKVKHTAQQQNWEK